jgi:hypothetical protein
MVSRCGIPLAVLLGLAGLAPAADPVQPLSGEEIADIWKQRQDKVRTATFEFTRTVYYPKGGFSKANPYIVHEWAETYPELGNTPIPTKDMRLSSPARLLVDGSKVRHDYQSEQFHFTKRDYYLQKEQTAFDGTHFRSISGTQEGKDEGAVRKAGNYQEGNLVSISSPLTAIRGRTKGLTMVPDVRTVTPTGRRVTFDGAECLEYLVSKEPDGSHHRHVWLAPAWGWQIVRDISHAVRNDIMSKKEVRYKTDPTVGWLPVSWEFARIEKGEVLLQSRHTLDSYTDR